MGNYYIPISTLFKNISGAEVIIPPPITKRTIALGAQHSPDFVCVPFKYNLGNFIESLELGANFLIQTHGGCRMGYYGEVQEQILRDLNYKFEFCMVNSLKSSPKVYYKIFKKINPKLNLLKTSKAFLLAYEQLKAIEEIEEIIRRNIGFEEIKNSFEKLEKIFLKKLEKAHNWSMARKIHKDFKKKFLNLKINKPEVPLKIAIVGELYVLMEPFSNYFLEKELAKFGIEITRFITASYLLFSPMHKDDRKIVKKTKGYLKYHIGADGADSVARSLWAAENNFDGIIHIKPFGCTPEVNSIPVLQKISLDKKIPILYFSVDAQTSETGIKTRLEAFYDMLKMKREKEV